GLGKVIWNIDGVTLGVTRASSSRAVRGQAIPHAQRLPLAPGTNTITVVAYEQRDLVASTQATVTVHLASPPPAYSPATPSVPPPSTPLSQSLPPLVAFVAPADGSTVTQPKIDVQVILTDQGGGVGKVLWTLNEAPVTTETGVGRSVEKRGGKRSL